MVLSWDSIFLDMVDLVSQCFNGLVQEKSQGNRCFFSYLHVDRVFCRFSNSGRVAAVSSHVKKDRAALRDVC